MANISLDHVKRRLLALEERRILAIKFDLLVHELGVALIQNFLGNTD